MKTLTPIFALSALCLSLAACGGGGSDGGPAPAPSPVSPAPVPLVPTPAPTPGPTLTPNPIALPDPTAAPVPTLAPATTPTPLPTLDKPQPGSTAATGNGIQGLWRGSDGSFALISASGEFRYVDETSLTEGQVSFSASTWKVDKARTMTGTDAEVAGTGSYAANLMLMGFLGGKSSTSKILGLDFERSNALAVSQRTVAASFAGPDAVLTIDQQGQVSGTSVNAKLGTCLLTGTLIQTEAGTSRNLYTLTLVATDAAPGTARACTMVLGVPFTGLAAYFWGGRVGAEDGGALFMAINTAAGSYWHGRFFQREPQ